MCDLKNTTLNKNNLIYFLKPIHLDVALRWFSISIQCLSSEMG